mgnify:FL=1
MKKIKIFTFNFDTKVKIIMMCSILISVVIIIYSFYNICIENGIKSKSISNKGNLFNIEEYEAQYTITINSNKNTNTYKVKEITNILQNEYTYIIDDILNINITNNQINISKENIDYKYAIEKMSDYGNSNFMSFSTVINIINSIRNNSISGNIKKIENDGNVVYKIHTDNEVVSNIKDIDVEMSKNEDKINQIKIYNLDGKEQYLIVFESFIVKK